MIIDVENHLDVLDDHLDVLDDQRIREERTHAIRGASRRRATPTEHDHLLGEQTPRHTWRREGGGRGATSRRNLYSDGTPAARGLDTDTPSH